MLFGAAHRAEMRTGRCNNDCIISCQSACRPQPAPPITTIINPMLPCGEPGDHQRTSSLHLPWIYILIRKLVGGRGEALRLVMSLFWTPGVFPLCPVGISGQDLLIWIRD